jgi:hypothetical protein
MRIKLESGEAVREKFACLLFPYVIWNFFLFFTSYCSHSPGFLLRFWFWDAAAPVDVLAVIETIHAILF